MRHASRDYLNDQVETSATLSGFALNVVAGVLLALAALVFCPWLVFGPPVRVGHYTVYSDGPWPRQFAPAVRQADRLLRRQGLTPPDEQTIYLCSTPWRFLLLSGARPDEYNGVFTYETGRIALVTPHLVGRDYTVAGHWALAETIAHELAHSSVNRILGSRMADVPIWKSEGISTRVEFGADGYLGRSGSGRYVRNEDEDPTYFRDRVLLTEIAGNAPLRDSTVLRIFADPRTATELRAEVLRRHRATAAELPEPDPAMWSVVQSLRTIRGRIGWLLRTALGHP